jgi:hypothetical protein
MCNSDDRHQTQSKSPVNYQRQMQASKKLLQKLINELSFDSNLDEEKLSRSHFNKGREYLTIAELFQWVKKSPFLQNKYANASF